MYLSKAAMAGILVSISLVAGCQNNIFQPQSATPQALSAVPAVRLNYRYEADVPAPSVQPGRPSTDERNPAVQTDFDNTRPQEILDRTLTSPDKKHVVAIYHRVTDVLSEYRLDMYSPDGKPARKLTSESMAVHFPDTIVWSPDSTTLAFVAMLRAGQVDSSGALLPPGPPDLGTPPVTNNTGDQNTNEAVSPTPAPTQPPPTGVLTFRTEQIYICTADGSGVKPITENEGLIYFYYTWSPDSTMLAALATTSREWKYMDISAAGKGEVMIPQGRPRIIEKNGRERRLDDNPTAVRPVWSQDSAKVADAFGTQIRIYDANGTNPTQAAIPMRNQLLISSQAYDRDQQRQLQAANSDTTANNPPPANDQPVSTLPDEKQLVSFNPIVELIWPSDDLLYVKTAYVRRMKNDADSVTSFGRWHRLVLTAQPTQPANR